MKNSTRNSPLLSETDGYENMAQQRIMRCTRETNQIMGKTVFFSYKTEKCHFEKQSAKKKKYHKIHKTVFGFVLLKFMTCAVPRLVLIYGAHMQISAEMTKLGSRCFIHCFIF